MNRGNLGGGAWGGVKRRRVFLFTHRCGRAELLFLVLQRCADEGCKQRMRLQWLGFEFRMKLAAEEPRMVRRFDNFHVILVGCASRNFQAGGDQRFFVVAVEFVAVAMPFADLEFAVGFVRE